MSSSSPQATAGLDCTLPRWVSKQWHRPLQAPVSLNDAFGKNYRGMNRFKRVYGRFLNLRLPSGNTAEASAEALGWELQSDLFGNGLRCDARRFDMQQSSLHQI